MHIHVIGICGTFMAGMASLAKDLGHTVTGCDQNVYPPMSTFLESKDIQITQGFDANQVSLKPDLFIVGNVVSRGNPLMEEILNQNLIYQSGPQWLYENLLHDKWVIAVSGTHGKTTTTSMINWILRENDIDCGYLIGGIPGNFSSSSSLSKSDSPFFVIEADEYDTAFFDKRSKFIHYRPKTLVINNIEFDHADIFDDISHIKRHFHHLIRTVPQQGKIIINQQDKNTKETVDMGIWSEIEEFNSSESWHIDQIDQEKSLFYKEKKIGKLNWNLIGEHNELNAIAAILAARHVGVSEENALRSLSSFKNTKRRLEIIYKKNNLTIYDDFAHHPTAIHFIAETFSNNFPKDKTLFVIDPRSNTMKRGDLKEDLRNILRNIPAFMLFSKDLLWDPVKYLADLDSKIFIAEDASEFIEKLKNIIFHYDHIVFLSNGSFEGVQSKIIGFLENENS
jgi:UDP-N-acetylmuramate: L-alanyl-gamma-D-glutamyl-meso-diaminopimelate ligase